jgi:hypothetical protein
MNFRPPMSKTRSPLSKCRSKTHKAPVIPNCLVHCTILHNQHSIHLLLYLAGNSNTGSLSANSDRTGLAGISVALTYAYFSLATGVASNSYGVP